MPSSPIDVQTIGRMSDITDYLPLSLHPKVQGRRVPTRWNHTTVQGEREVKLGSHEITVTIIPSPNGAGGMAQEEPEGVEDPGAGGMAQEEGVGGKESHDCTR